MKSLPYCVKILLNQLAIAAGGFAVDRCLFSRATHIAASALWTLIGALVSGALLDATGDVDSLGLVTTFIVTLVNTIASIVISFLSSMKEGAEYFLITLSLGLIAGMAHAVFFSRDEEHKGEGKSD